MSETVWDQSYPPSIFVISVTGVTAGSPGAFAPANATLPANLTALRTDPVVGNAGTNKPVAAWTVGQYVVLGDSSQASWTGVLWQAGAVAPAERATSSSKRTASRTGTDTPESS